MVQQLSKRRFRHGNMRYQLRWSSEDGCYIARVTSPASARWVVADGRRKATAVRRLKELLADVADLL